MGLFAWYTSDHVFNYVLNTVETAYPSYFTGSGPDFLVAFIKWSLLFVILIGGLIYIAVQSQKPKERYY